MLKNLKKLTTKNTRKLAFKLVVFLGLNLCFVLPPYSSQATSSSCYTQDCTQDCWNFVNHTLNKLYNKQQQCKLPINLGMLKKIFHFFNKSIKNNNKIDILSFIFKNMLSYGPHRYFVFSQQVSHMLKFAHYNYSYFIKLLLKITPIDKANQTLFNLNPNQFTFKNPSLKIFHEANINMINFYLQDFFKAVSKQETTQFKNMLQYEPYKLVELLDAIRKEGILNKNNPYLRYLDKFIKIFLFYDKYHFFSATQKQFAQIIHRVRSFFDNSQIFFQRGNNSLSIFFILQNHIYQAHVPLFNKDFEMIINQEVLEVEKIIKQDNWGLIRTTKNRCFVFDKNGNNLAQLIIEDFNHYPSLKNFLKNHVNNYAMSLSLENFFGIKNSNEITLYTAYSLLNYALDEPHKSPHPVLQLYHALKTSATPKASSLSRHLAGSMQQLILLPPQNSYAKNFSQEVFFQHPINKFMVDFYNQSFAHEPINMQYRDEVFFNKFNINKPLTTPYKIHNMVIGDIFNNHAELKDYLFSNYTAYMVV